MTDSAPDAYPLTAMQQGILYHVLSEPDSGLYVQQVECTVTGDLDVPAFQRAWQATVNRHEALRTAIYWEGLSEPLQVVLPAARLAWTVRDLTAADAESELAAYRSADRLSGLALDTAPLMRCALFRLSPQRHRLLWTYHHIILDGWSFSLVLKEVFAGYAAGTGRGDRPAGPVTQFREHVALTRAMDRASQQAFWRSRLADITEPTPLPGLRDPNGKPEPAGELRRTLTPETSAALAAFGRSHRLGAASLAAGAWAHVLGGLADDDDVVFGMTVAGRPAGLPYADTVVGLCINTIPVRLRLSADLRRADWLQGVQDELLRCQDHEQTPLVDSQRCAGIPRGRPLFETLLLVQTEDELPAGPARQAGITVEFTRSEPPRTNYPLTIMVLPGVQWRIRLVHDRSALDDRTAGELLDAYAAALTELPQDAQSDPLPVPGMAGTVVRISAAGTFTVTAMADTVRFWLRHLGLRATVRFGRYGQMTQELLLPGSPLARADYRLLFLRLDDLAPADGLARTETGPPGDRAAAVSVALCAAVDDLVEAIAYPAAGRTLVVLCPTEPGALPRQAVQQAAGRLRRRLADLPGVAVRDTDPLTDSFAVARVHDPAASAAGHVPYTPEYIAALATDAVRQVIAASGAGPSVMVLDADGTLWTGAAGEDAAPAGHGSAGEAVLRAAHRWARAGRPVAVAARGARADIAGALDRFAPSLRNEGLAALEVSPAAASAAVAAVAEDLGLPESELLYLTADPVNWADTAANCPAAQAVHVPSAAFAEHLWTLDLPPPGWA